jgi:putative transposase
MKHKRFSDEQVIGVLKEHEAGAKVDDICRRHAISTATFYTWRKKYGGMEAKRREAAARTRGGERQAQADRRGPGARHVGDEGTARKTLVSPWPGDEPWAF